MPVYSRSEFCKLLGISQATITVNVTRGKLVLINKNQIDTGLPMNKAFYDKNLKNKEEKEILPPKEKPDPKPVPKKEVIKKTVYNNDEDEARVVDAVNKYNLDLQIKQLELEKKEQEIELNRLKIAKLSGEVIPTDLVQIIFSQQSKSITTAFHQGADNFIIDIAKRTGLERKEMADLRGILIAIINESVKDANADSKAAVKNIVKEYSQKRGVGERE